MSLSQHEITALRWARSCNQDGIGYLGPTVKRTGPLPELEPVVRKGFLRCAQGTPGLGRRNWRELGYWLTDAGRRELASI